MRDVEHWTASKESDEWVVIYTVPEDEQRINSISGVEAHVRVSDGAVVKCVESMLVS
jgi:hypothetical protein